MGPGCSSPCYEEALCVELEDAGVRVERQAEIVVDYKGRPIRGQRLDVLVDGKLIVELKSVASIQDVHAAQLLSYLRAAGLPLGLLINFSQPRLKDGLRRIINERAVSPSSATRPSRSSE